LPELRFDGKVALVTGGGRGLGRAHARFLAARGCRVLVNDPGVTTAGSQSGERPADEVAREITEAGGEAVADHHNVVGEAELIVAHAASEWGRLDVVVNNAGISGGGPFVTIPKDEFELMLATHLGGTVDVTRAAWPHLVAAGTGRIVNTSSPAMFGGAGTSHYITAKAALFGLNRALAREGAPLGIHSNAIMPTAYTRLTAQIPEDGFRRFLVDFYPPEAVAPFVVWLAHADTGVNGEAFSVGGGRAARVFLAEAAGAVVDEATPEAWAAKLDELMTIGEYGVPVTMGDEVRFQAEHFGGALAEAFARIDARQWTGADDGG
jgi:NAD(P)-dependent dehydrogenase (short-subunit alcohol dehydrogenase family)